MKHHEIEVKFYLTNRELIADRIYKIGGDCLGKHFETNIRYENTKKNLIKNQKLLIRLRKTDKTTLTIKKPSEIRSQEFKINQELEVTVSNFDMMNNILNALGYYSEQVYEKWRETWQIGETLLCLDRMPYGYFLEIEGNPHEIKAVSVNLGLTWSKRIIASYLEIFEVMKKKESFDFNNLEFDKFKNKLNNFSKYRWLFENKSTKICHN